MRRILTRLTKWWARVTAPRLERVICGCGMEFYRPIVPHPETCCDGCRDEHMDAWLRELQQTGKPLW